MESSPRPLTLDDPGLLSRYDPGSIERGVRYAAQGRVVVVDEGPGWVTASVRGSRVEPYVTDVEWSDSPQGPVVSDVCSCPLGGSCKHVIALIVSIALTHDDAEVRSIRSAPSAPLHFTDLDDDDNERRRQLVMAERARQSRLDPFPGFSLPTWPHERRGPMDWRDALADVAVASTSGAAPMALQFTVLSPRPTAYVPDPGTRIMVRPMRSGAKGKWVKSGASWHDIDSPYVHHSLRSAVPSHLVMLRSLGQCISGSLSSAGNDAIGLERFGAGVWTALRNAVTAGVRLVSGSGDDITVTLAADPAKITVDLTARAEQGGDISLRAGFVRDGEPLELSPGRIGTIGSPPHGLYVIAGNRLELVPVDGTVPAGVARLLGAPPLAIPADDVDEFLDDYLPPLARAATVTSSDGSVIDHTAHLDGLVALVDHHQVDAARLSWMVRYRRGDRVTAYRSWDSAGAVRDRAAEQALLAAVDLPHHLMEGLVGHSGRPADLSVRGLDAVTLLTQVVPWLVERDQVAVEITGDAPELRQAAGDPLIALDVTEGDDGAGGHTDWFDLSVEVSIDGEPIEFAHIFRALAMDEPALVLPSGTWLHLDRPELDQLRELIEEARGLTDRDGATLRVNPFQTTWWNELTSLGVVRSQSQRWADAIRRLRDFDAPTPVDPPAGLAATLRPYQQHGLDWLAFLHRNELGGILADDMGLGKTVQTLALFLYVLDRRPDARFLVVAPTSVVANWHKEAAQFAPGVEVRAVTETASRRKVGLADVVGDARIVVTSYALFRLEFDDYRALDWDMLVLDEAQFVKNHRAKTYQCVRRLDAPTKLAITGTPIENSLMDLWSLLSIVAPGLYPDPKRFSDVYQRPIESGQAPELLATLRRRVAPLMRRRTKDEVLTELPPKTEQIVDVELSARHMRLYQTQLQRQRKKVLGLVGDVDQHRFEILKSLTILRQLSLDPALIDDEHDAVGSAKLDRLVEDLTLVTAEGHRALVFSTFTRFLARAKWRLDEAGIGYAYLDGRTRKRESVIASFKDGAAPVFLISLKAGGFGLNLTEADYCFVLDPWWNPAAETQAVDRAHRIGQENPVMVYRYVSTGTIEEKVMELQERKRALVSSVMDDDGALSGALDAEDIRALIDLPDASANREAESQASRTRR